MAGNDHLLAGLDRPDQLGQTVLRLCCTDNHVKNYSYKLWL
jgi:hypothetical protein